MKKKTDSTPQPTTFTSLSFNVILPVLEADLEESCSGCNIQRPHKLFFNNYGQNHLLTCR